MHHCMTLLQYQQLQVYKYIYIYMFACSMYVQDNKVYKQFKAAFPQYRYNIGINITITVIYTV